jgi:glycosyltransferase involved in cell wall biosynthesis
MGGRQGEGLGWIGALEQALERQGDLELGIAFPWPVAEVEVRSVHQHVYYAFPRYPRGGRLRQLLFDVSCRLEPERETRHLERIVERHRPDLIHVWGTEPFFGLVAAKVEVPVLFELQGPRTPNTAAYLSGLTKLDLLRHGSRKRLLNGRSLLHRYYRYRRSAVRERRMLLAARFVSGRTAWDRTIGAVLAPEARYFHADRVLRPPFYQARRQPPPDDGPLELISTLRGNAYKGFETVAECAGLLRRLLPRAPRWTILGASSDDEIHRVVERKLGIAFAALGVEFAGRQPAGEVASRLAAAHAFVHPSRADNSPNGVCEAMIVGLPVVSTNVGGIPSLVTDGHDGLLVPPGDPWAMAAAIRRLAADPTLAARLGAAARATATRRHDPAAIAATTLSIYREILSSGRSAPESRL